MIPAHLKPHQVVPLVSQLVTDVYGNQRREAGPAGEPVPAYVQPETNRVETADGQLRITEYRVFLEPVDGLDAWSALEWEGRRYELTGDPERFDTPDGRHHVRVRVRRVGG